MIWITCDTDRARHSALSDSLPDWVPTGKEEGKKVVLYGVECDLWRTHAAVKTLVDQKILHQSKHRACHRP